MKFNFKTILSLLSTLLFFSIALNLYLGYEKIFIEPTVVEGTKSQITLIVKADVENHDYLYDKYVLIDSEAKFLKDVLDEVGLVYTESGGFVNTINNIELRTSPFEYWAIYVNDNYGELGIESQPVKDGDVFKFELTVYQPE